MGYNRHLSQSQCTFEKQFVEGLPCRENGRFVSVLSSIPLTLSYIGRVLFVAGGCGIIGSGIAMAFLADGAKVVVNSRSAARLDQFLGTVPPDLRRNLTTIQEDCDSEESVTRIKDFIIKEYSKIDDVVTSLGSNWQGGVLTDQSLEDFRTEIHNCAETSFMVSKIFLPYLATREGSTFTYITGAAGENCFDPTISLLTVRTACLFGVAEAARAQFFESNVSVLEMRVGLFVYPKPDSAFDSQPSVVGSDFMGKVCASLIKRKPPKVVRLNTRHDMEKLLKKGD